MPDAFENSGIDRTELAQKRRRFLAELGTESVVDDNAGEGSAAGRRRPMLMRLAGLAAVTAAVGAAMVTGSGVASAAGCTPNGNPLPIPQSQSYFCGGYWDNYTFMYEDADGHCYYFDWWWNILACAGGPSHRGTAIACE